MRISKTNSKEINSLLKLLQDMEQYSKDQQGWEDVNFNQRNYPKLAKLGNPEKDPEDFVNQLCFQMNRIHFQRILWNLLTLLDNCADKGLGHLDFNPKIKAGFEALEILKEVLPLVKKNGAAENKELKAKIDAVFKMAKKRTMKPKVQKAPDEQLQKQA